ncbi:hypothetical protein DL762_002797 [Monosporascus cannonballus]|uniref:Uncharacterized protein n=1 Tax=Monosporascus cannonballus TaxID=155416 RepID=A0ABY0HD29_9PEZI|nr:hypothetical protein DL762_002797 [Monosporascus cannonballus]
MYEMPVTIFNHTCGQHVHVGRGTDGFELPALQRLVSVLWIGGEEILNAVHPAYRTNGLFCPSLHTSTLLAKGKAAWPQGVLQADWLQRCGITEDEPSARLRANLEAIWSAGSVDELCDMLVGDGKEKPAYNFANLKPPSDDPAGVSFAHLIPRRPPPEVFPIEEFPIDDDPADKKITIEFRQAGGDIKGDDGFEFVMAWVRVATGLVAWAIDADAEDFAKLTRDIRECRGENKAFRVGIFLNAIGIPGEDIERMMARVAQLE